MNPKPYTLKPKPQTLNPNAQSRSQKVVFFAKNDNLEVPNPLSEVRVRS